MITNSCHLHRWDDLHWVMNACLRLHNMIIEEERQDDAEMRHHFDNSEENGPNTTIFHNTNEQFTSFPSHMKSRLSYVIRAMLWHRHRLLFSIEWSIHSEELSSTHNKNVRTFTARCANPKALEVLRFAAHELPLMRRKAQTGETQCCPVNGPF
ncbi:hypothetical protein K470DRAFT_229248 [Piedraia hortae CBS 480.64]|uniref:Uncharacterized protein n=1 Tax=Piedraia hortae CBS 480.64 TaxID=1314780 RepID=A0A6A7C3M9_9PEZI|nr:hypothetical protein K470DRAFT_229248 [Piedraia hortae CBS 480.64]